MISSYVNTCFYYTVIVLIIAVPRRGRDDGDEIRLSGGRNEMSAINRWPLSNTLESINRPRIYISNSRKKNSLSLSLCLSTNIRDNEVSTYTQVRWFVGLLDWFEKLSSTPSFPDYRFGIFRNSIKPLPPLFLLLPQIIRNSRNCRVPSGNNTIFSPPFLLSFSEPEEPDHDDERLGGTSEYHATLHLEISLFLRLEYEKKKKKSKNS